LSENTGSEQTINIPMAAKPAPLDRKSTPHKTNIMTKNNGLANSGKIL
jgi:hypothetical protein